MVFKSIDGSFCVITEMYVHGIKLVVDIYLKEGLPEEIKGFIMHYMELGLLSIICEYTKEFLNPFVDACAFSI